MAVHRARTSTFRTALLILAVVAGILAALLFAVAWFYSGQVHSGALVVDHKPSELDLRVLELRGGLIDRSPGLGLETSVGASILLGAAGDNPELAKNNSVGLEFAGGYAQLGHVLERTPAGVRRAIVAASTPPQAGTRARLDSFYFPSDPQVALGLDFSTVEIHSTIGVLPAWYVPGTRATWVIFVHGKGADRREGLRLLSVVGPEGFPFLDITYRNDAGAPQVGNFGYGISEWPDLEAAVAFATDHSAAEVVLAGNSMGGAIVLSFMQQSQLASRVRGLILDAPVIDLAAAIDFQGKRRHLPSPITGLSEWLVARRFGLDWHAVDYRAETKRLAVPVLLFHGDADQTVPVSTSDAFARSRPDVVTYLRVPGAGHVRSWNQDPEAYALAVRTFLERPCMSLNQAGC